MGQANTNLPRSHDDHNDEFNSARLAQLIIKFPLFCKHKVHHHVTRAGHVTLSQTGCIQPTLQHSISIRSTLILFSYTCLGLSSSLPAGLLTKCLYDFLICITYVLRPFHILSLNLKSQKNVAKRTHMELLIPPSSFRFLYLKWNYFRPILFSIYANHNFSQRVREV